MTKPISDAASKIPPNAGKIRKSPGFADHHPSHRWQLGAAHHHGGARQEHGRKLGEGPVEGFGCVFDCFQVRSDRGPRNGAEKFFLGLKVEVEGAF